VKSALGGGICRGSTDHVYLKDLPIEKTQENRARRPGDEDDDTEKVLCEKSNNTVGLE
jgi:hypothetical protein